MHPFYIFFPDKIQRDIILINKFITEEDDYEKKTA